MTEPVEELIIQRILAECRGDQYDVVLNVLAKAGMRHKCSICGWICMSFNAICTHDIEANNAIC
jgi:hypothetical protein